MNIETPKINSSIRSEVKQTSSNQQSSVKFSDELKELQETPKTEEKEKVEETKNSTKAEDKESKDVDKAYDDLNSVVEELNKGEVDQSEDKLNQIIKKDESLADKNNMINNDFNIQENKDLLPQMNPNMNFSGDGQPFSSFMNNGEQQASHNVIDSSAKDLAEEAAILSTMAENIALANKRTVTREDGIKKVNAQTGITTETIVKFDSVIMNQADVEIFADLVKHGEVNMNNLAPEAVQKGINVSKTLANMLAKSMENNQPLRIDFDNNISVIIRISRDGKISADFLPSSQVAEAYLKENLPLLRQRFDDNNIKYDELSQRERREQNRDNNRKKGNRDE